MGAAGACALLGGCIGDPFGEAKVDPNSPVAADVTRVTMAKATFPSFRDIPAASKDNRPIVQYGVAARQILAAGDQVITATEPNTWTLKDTEAFADKARQNVGPDLPPPVPGATDEELKKLRERATPPPPRPRR